jgi:hypothetical protein
MAEVALELVCGRCGTLWLRWDAITDQPFEDDPLAHRPFVADVVFLGPTGMPVDIRGRRGWSSRVTFECLGCPSDVKGRKPNVKARMEKLNATAVKALRYLYDARTPLPQRSTVNQLLKAAKVGA